MPEKIFKSLRVVQKCQDCTKKFTSHILAEVNSNFKIADLSNAVTVSPKIKKTCVRCKSSKFTYTYSFYHDQTLMANA